MHLPIVVKYLMDKSAYSGCQNHKLSKSCRLFLIAMTENFKIDSI